MKALLLTLLLGILSFQISAQVVFPFASSIGVGTSTPDASSALDITSNSKGILVPRLTAASRAGISAPAQGLLVYQTDGTPGFYYFQGSAWQKLGATSGWNDFAFFVETGAAGTTGAGTPTLNSWTDRTINTTVSSSTPTSISLSSAAATNKLISLQPGTYYIRASAPATPGTSAQLTMITVRKSSDNSVILYGTSEFANNSEIVQVRSSVEGTFTLTAPTTIKLSQYFSAINSSNPPATMGARNAALQALGIPQIYSQVFIQKIQ